MRVLFFGSPAFAVPTLEAMAAAGLDLAGVVTQPDRPRGRGQHVSPGPVKVAATALGLPILQPERLSAPGLPESLAALRADIGVVAAYGQLLPDWLLRLPPRGMVNVHASLLPRYRGAAPVHRAILDGARETGVTIMRVVKKLDAGPMLDRVVVPIDENETSEALEQRLATVGARLLVDVLGRLAAGEVAETPQRDEDATYAAKLTRADGPIDWRRSARAIHDQIRGLQPWPRASATIGGTRLIVHRSRVTGTAAAGAPGRILEISRAGADVATGDGVLRLLELQAENGRRQPAAAVLGSGPLAAAGGFDLP